MNKLKGYRTMIGITQEEMAKKIGMSRRAYVEREKDGKFTVEQANSIVGVIKEKKHDITYEDIFF